MIIKYFKQQKNEIGRVFENVDHAHFNIYQLFVLTTIIRTKRNFINLKYFFAYLIHFEFAKQKLKKLFLLQIFDILNSVLINFNY